LVKKHKNKIQSAESDHTLWEKTNSSMESQNNVVTPVTIVVR